MKQSYYRNFATNHVKHMDISTEVLLNKHATVLPIQKAVCLMVKHWIFTSVN